MLGRVAIGSLILGTLVVVACGDDPDPNDSGTSTTTTTSSTSSSTSTATGGGGGAGGSTATGGSGGAGAVGGSGGGTGLTPLEESCSARCAHQAQMVPGCQDDAQCNLDCIDAATITGNECTAEQIAYSDCITTLPQEALECDTLFSQVWPLTDVTTCSSQDAALGTCVSQ